MRALNWVEKHLDIIKFVVAILLPSRVKPAFDLFSLEKLNEALGVTLSWRFPHWTAPPQ
jgi:hypothetical protein